MNRFRVPWLVLAALTTCHCASDSTQSLVGYVEADWHYVASPESGWIVSSSLSEGAQVVPGSELFQLDSELEELTVAGAERQLERSRAQSRDLETGLRDEELERLADELREAEANAELAAVEDARLRALAKEGIVPRQAADQAAASRQATAARVDALRSALDVARLPARSQVRAAARQSEAAAEVAVDEALERASRRTVAARTSGRVEEIFYREGEFVAAGAAVAAILPEGRAEVRFFVAQADLPRLALGDRIEVAADGSPPTEALVHFVANAPEFTPPVLYGPGSRERLVFAVRARLADGHGLPIGLPVDVRLP